MTGHAGKSAKSETTPENILTFCFVFCIIDMKVMRGSGLS